MGSPRFTFLLLAITFSLCCHLLQARLIQSFESCPNLNSYYISRVLPLVGPYGLTSSNAYVRSEYPRRSCRNCRPGGPAGLRLRRPMRDPRRITRSNITVVEPRPTNEDNENGPVEGRDFSTTNVQVRGVDEPDIIKTDGRRVFTLSGTTFSVVKVLEEGAAGNRTGRLELPSYPREMLIEGDWVLAIGTYYDYTRPYPYQRYQEDSSHTQSATVIYQIYVGGRRPRLISTLYLEGNYVKSREVDGVARIVLRFNPLDSIWLFYATGRITRNQTRRWNREIIQNSRAGDWLPTYRLIRNGGRQTGVYASCEEVFYSPRIFAGFDLLTVITLPVDGLLTPRSSASIVSDAEIVYSTATTMYVTTSEFHFDDLSDDDERWGANYETSIHKFNLSDDGASYVASGTVTGSLINQFAMHEYQGTFFIATTDGASWWSNRDLSASKVSAFIPNERSRVLTKVGEVGNLGIGERIFSVRYIRDTAYVVTFREVDPLYIVDLSNPRELNVTGELKIPGFSSYLHPVLPNRILGVGQEATLTGRLLGAKVSLFDVSDKTNPTELSTWSLRGSYSNAEWDHRAFLWWKREGVAVMPVNVYSGRRSFQGAIVLDVTDRNITERGRVEHIIDSSSYTPSIRRNAIIGGVHLWSMSYDHLQVNNLNNLDNVEDQISINS
eukprot:GFKZ01014299.1.p1 GENE.GFKZ01014299.1~~GFKZ01014299.1.p1  ORF type:complete len:667 (-),score=44.74 GFKZ01014299.1:173-2173(-)